MEEEFKRLERDKLWPGYFSNLLEKSNLHTFHAADLLYNLSLNRYLDVKAYDRSRIKLTRTTDTDYINANEVNVAKAGRRYILTQGPLDGTLGHFWLMIWEQNTNIIVMLNKIIEMEGFAKCVQYWPDRVADTISFDDVGLSVTLKHAKKHKHYIVREMILEDYVGLNHRIVRQFHYMAWPDYSEPESPVTFLRLLAGVRKSGGLDRMDKPAVVHCSAGIGRSGTFCLIDSVLTMIENQGSADNIDVGATLLEMRDYRMGLIQTDIQLRFAYKSIIYGIKALERAHKLRPHPSKKRRTNGSPMNGPKRRVRNRKSNGSSTRVNSSLLVDALEDADSDTLEEAFDISMTESPTLKKPRSEPTNGNDLSLFTVANSNESDDKADEQRPDSNGNGDIHNLSPINLDEILSDQISNNSINYLNVSATSDSIGLSVLQRRRERELKLIEKTNIIKMKMKAEELRKERYIQNTALLKKAIYYGGIAVAVGSVSLYMYMSRHGI